MRRTCTDLNGRRMLYSYPASPWIVSFEPAPTSSNAPSPPAGGQPALHDRDARYCKRCGTHLPAPGLPGARRGWCLTSELAGRDTDPNKINSMHSEEPQPSKRLRIICAVYALSISRQGLSAKSLHCGESQYRDSNEQIPASDSCPPCYRTTQVGRSEREPLAVV